MVANRRPAAPPPAVDARPQGRGRRRAALWGAGLLTALALFGGQQLHASAHSVLVSSQPAPGAQLATAPGVVVLDFSERIDGGLSSTTVTDPLGHRATASLSSATEMRVTLVTNAPGEYRVSWISVSAVDGHRWSSAFTFTVASRSSGGESGAAAGGGPSVADVAVAAARWVEDAALLLAIGMLLVRWLGRRQPALEWVRPRLLEALAVALGAGAAVVAGEALSASGGSVPGAVSYLTGGAAGAARLARIALEGWAVVAVRAGPRLVWPAVVAPVAALPFAGHATGADPAWWGLATNAVHLVAAGAWAGGIMAMATLRPPGGWRAGGRELLIRFSPWALLAFWTTVSFGAFQGLLDVGSWGALTGSGYGRVLIGKIALVAVMLPLSLLAWRRRRPHPRIEGSTAVAVVAAAAVLASLSPPASRLSASAPAPAQPSGAGLPGGSELTLGDHAGTVLIGLTISPALPGRNSLRVYVRSLDSAAQAADLPVSSSVDGAPVGVAPCGATCRQATASLRGGDEISVSVTGASGGTAVFRLPQLPAPDGSALLARAQRRTDALSALTEHETLTSGVGTTVMTDYTWVAPDRLAFSTSNGSSTVVIGSTRYSRDQDGAPWTKQTGVPIVTVPGFVWDSFSPYVGTHVVGADDVDGVATTVVAFFGGDARTPVWFELWIDDAGLVRRAHMRAEGHFMDQTFAGFDTPLAVSPPPGF